MSPVIRRFRSPLRARPAGAAVAGCRGSVTAETAAALPALVVVLAAGLWAIAVVGAQLECTDAARTGARAASRGEPLDRVRGRVLAAAPAGARAEVTRDSERARVEVSVEVRPGWSLPLPEVTVRATAVSATEPGVEQADVSGRGAAVRPDVSEDRPDASGEGHVGEGPSPGAGEGPSPGAGGAP
ncbi:hypothetical protein GCM10010466_64420 [Planomonospora alba]|uniref:TadE-like protein n=1 Tax=Planomonospora alba TaxID=161354 RepID=A0ABP6P1W1_9ACTN